MEEAISKKNKADVLNIFDRSKNVRVRIVLSENRRHWEKWISKLNGKWELLGKVKTLDEVIKSQQDIIDNNYKNLFNIINKK